ncbi:hypothetical protein CPB84DRAFT_1820973 [Gymnopilus junonius]|uniref:Uncharacterized protein n=1 Tax=Gymnopilus junonius TaxID=109634 RepID=A0A9P5P1G5_GYMJU|nr:hypothetical protein CPB84DRAFT_1820973 [Gymnopilus junonius]
MSPSMAIPPNIFQVLLPQDSLNILALSKFSVPSEKNAPNLLSLFDDKLFSKTASLVEKEDQTSWNYVKEGTMPLPTARIFYLSPTPETETEKILDDEDEDDSWLDKGPNDHVNYRPPRLVGGNLPYIEKWPQDETVYNTAIPRPIKKAGYLFSVGREVKERQTQWEGK